MRTTGQNRFMPAALALLALSPGQAMSMMGHDGPPPCESQACFVEAVSACRTDASYMTRTAAGAQVQYRVEGATENGRCRLGMIYMQHPEPDWTYKPLHFVLDREGDISTRLGKTVTDCLSGRADSDRQCRGPLLEISGAADR